MKFVRYVGIRKARNGRENNVEIGLYICGYCGKKVKMSMSNGGSRSSCGCQTKSYKRVTIYRPKPAERTCLMCGNKFVSRGPHNRRCAVCEQKLANDGQAYYMPPIHKQRDHSVVAECFET